MSERGGKFSGCAEDSYFRDTGCRVYRYVCDDRYRRDGSAALDVISDADGTGAYYTACKKAAERPAHGHLRRMDKSDLRYLLYGGADLCDREVAFL